MIASYAPSRTSSLLRRITGIGLIVCLSLVLVALVALFEEVALALMAVVVMTGLAIWRPRYGIYAILLTAVPFDPYKGDPFMQFGYFMQTPISAMSSVKSIIISPIEFVLLITTLSVVISAVVQRRSGRPAQLRRPILLFLALMVLSFGYGLLTGGTFNIALWETRSMLAGVVVALLVPSVITRRGQVHQLIDLLTIGIVLLSVDIIWRRFTILANTTYLDLSFDHDTPIFMNIAVILLVARLVWPATGRQRLAALLIPLIIYAQMVTERRAGWVSLDVGLILIAIFVFRLRRKAFYFIVLPLLLVYVGYLGVFWNAQGAIAQPARAVRSVNNPEGRDLQSNIARMVERANIRMNIHAHPVTGLGFGQQYIFYLPMADLSWWPLWHYVAHTQLMWLWMKMGPVAFITFLTLCGAGIVRGVQLLKVAANNQSAPYLVAIVAALLMLVVYSYVDIALNSVRVMVLLGLVLGVIGVWGRENAMLEEAA